MTAFSPAQEAAIQSLIALWGYDRTVLVGGGALAAWTGMSWRPTQDVDFVVLVDPEEAARTLASAPGWRKDPRSVPRWVYGESVLVDVVPVTQAGLDAGEQRWHRSDALMSTVGLDLAFERAVPFRLSDGTPLRVAPPPVVALL